MGLGCGVGGVSMGKGAGGVGEATMYEMVTMLCSLYELTCQFATVTQSHDL